MRKTDPRPAVAIINRTYLEPTQIWIARHADSLRQFRPFFIVRKKVRKTRACRRRVIILSSFGFLTAPLDWFCRGLLKKRPLGSAWALRLILAFFRARLVHVHFLWNAVWFFALLPEMKIPVFVTAHGSDVSMALSDEIYKKKVQDIFDRAESIICVSEFIRKKLLLLGAAEKKLVVNYLGAPLREIPGPKRGRKETLDLICVAALRQEKGHAYLIQAVSRVRKDFTDIRLSLVGDGTMRNKILGLIGDLGLQDCVRILGWKTEEEVFRLLAEADVYVQHSIPCLTEGRIWREEGLPISLVEAAGMGLPIVATDIGGIPEICIHGFNGLLSPPQDIQAMADHILHLIRNPDIRSSFGQNGRALVEEKFNQSRLLRNLESLYQRRLSGASNKAR